MDDAVGKKFAEDEDSGTASGFPVGATPFFP
jgi:hypothetical protein